MSVTFDDLPDAKPKPKISFDDLPQAAHGLRFDDLPDAAPEPPTPEAEMSAYGNTMAKAEGTGNDWLGGETGLLPDRKNRTLWEAANTPLLNLIPKYNAEQTGDFLDNPEGATAIGGPLGTIAGGAYKVAKEKLGKDTADQLAAGAEHVAADAANSLLSPIGLGTLGLAKAPQIIQKLVAGMFAIHSIKNLPETYAAIRDAKTPQEKTEAIGNALLQAGIIVGAGKHATGRPALESHLIDNARHASTEALKVAVDDAALKEHMPDVHLAASRELSARETPSAETTGSAPPTATAEAPAAPAPAAEKTQPLAPREDPRVVDQAVRSEAGDWVDATEEAAEAPKQMKRAGGQAGAVTIPKFTDRTMSELDAATTERSARLQKSFDEATRAQKEIKKAIPSQKRQAAVSVWMEADGDTAKLKAWEAGAKGEQFRTAANLAQSLTPEEITIANRARAAFKVLAARGAKYDVLGAGRDNYVPHVWEVEKGKSGGGGGKLQEKFKFSKARTFETFVDGDAAGFIPKTLAIGRLLPGYLTEMNKVIADRQFVEDLSTKTAKDGRPLIVPRGRVSEIETDAGGKAFLANPDAMKGAKDAAGNPIDTADYSTMENQPALHEWRWEGKDENGNPIFMRDDLAVHPEAKKRINSMLGRSAIREWYDEPSEGASKVARTVAKAIDKSQSVMKREMFGLLSPFHQVQEGWHGIAHWVNPFYDLPKIDLRNPAQRDAAAHGLMILPDRTTSGSYMEGLGGKGTFLSQAARAIGEKYEGKPGAKAAETLSNIVDGYQNYLFHEYIPALKVKTYEAIRARNTHLYEKELKSGALTESDVKILSAEQTNAAYGHLNYALLDRNPTMQHILQLGLLAPDFLEARGRFTAQAVKGLAGSKVGREQFIAIARIAMVQAGIAFVLTELGGDDWDAKHPFEVVHGGRRYTLRSVPEDIASAAVDPWQFMMSRVNPLTVKGGVQLGTGLNYRGEKTSRIETIEELLAQYIPISARSFPGIRSLTETSQRSPVSPMEQFAGSVGLRISRKSPIADAYKLSSEWMEKQGIPKDKGSYPVSKYQQLRYALEDGDFDRAGKEYEKLTKVESPQKVSDGFRQSVNHPFTQSQTMDAKFRASLSESHKAVYDLAKKKRQEILNRFSSLRRHP